MVAAAFSFGFGDWNKGSRGEVELCELPRKYRRIDAVDSFGDEVALFGITVI